jgi:hypothetical protein
MTRFEIINKIKIMYYYYRNRKCQVCVEKIKNKLDIDFTPREFDNLLLTMANENERRKQIIYDHA